MRGAVQALVGLVLVGVIAAAVALAWAVLRGPAARNSSVDEVLRQMERDEATVPGSQPPPAEGSEHDSGRVAGSTERWDG